MSELDNGGAGENKTRDVIDAVTSLVQAVPVYQDVAQPAAREIGKALGTLAKTVNMALAPVGALVWGYEQLQGFISGKVADRLKNVPHEDIITPKPNVAGPAMDALRYIGHEDSLSDMYANLLASAMDRSTSQGAHPAFVEVIRQLTPDEAKLFGLFSSQSTFPLITVKQQREGSYATRELLVNFSHLSKLCSIEFPSLVPVYLDNFCRLGLLSIPDGQSLSAEGAYDALESDPAILDLKAKIESSPDMKIKISQGIVKTTEFGRQFVNACVREKT